MYIYDECTFMNKIILKIIALGLFLSGCDVFKDVENTAKPLNTTPSTLNKKPPPPPEANFPVTDAIDNIANAYDVLNNYIEPTDSSGVKKAKAQNILRLSKNGKSFLNNLADLPDTETSAVITDLSANLADSISLAKFANKEFIEKLLAKDADQSLRVVLANADPNTLDFPTDDKSKEHLLSLTTDPVITDKIIGPNKEAFADTIITSAHSNNDKKIKILDNLKSVSPAEKAQIEDKQVTLAQNILDDATENIEKIGNLDTIKNSIGDPVKKAHIEDKQVALTEDIFKDAAMDAAAKSAFLQYIKPSLIAADKQALIEEKEILLADQIIKDPAVSNNDKIDHLIDLKPTMSATNKNKIEQKFVVVANNLVSDETIDFDSNMQMIATIKNSLLDKYGYLTTFARVVDFHKTKLAEVILKSNSPAMDKIEKLQKIKDSITNNPDKNPINNKQFELAKNIIADKAISADDKAAALNALKPSLPADKKQEIEVAQVTDIFSDEAKLPEPASLVDELNKNNLLSGNKVINKSDLFKVDGAKDNLVGFYVAKLDAAVKPIDKRDIISGLKTKINPASNMAWRKIIETSPYLKKYFDEYNSIKDKQSSELLDYKIESSEVIDQAKTISIEALKSFIRSYFNANILLAEEVQGLLGSLIKGSGFSNNLISSLAKRNIVNTLEANKIMSFLNDINGILDGHLNENLPLNDANDAGETDILSLLKNNIAKPEIFNSLYEGLKGFTLANDSEAAFQDLIKFGWLAGADNVEKDSEININNLAVSSMNSDAEIDKVIKTLDILVDVSGGKDKFNKALRASTLNNSGHNPYYLISPMYRLLQKDRNNKIAYFCLKNDVQMINESFKNKDYESLKLYKDIINDMINSTKKDKVTRGDGRSSTEHGVETPLTNTLKYLLINNDATRDVYLKTFTWTHDKEEVINAYANFVLSVDNEESMLDKVKRINKTKFDWIGVNQSIKYSLMSDDNTRDIYLESYGKNENVVMYDGYSHYIDYILQDNTMDIDDKFKLIKKAARSVYNHNSSSYYRNNAIGGGELLSRLVKGRYDVPKKDYLKALSKDDSPWSYEDKATTFMEFIGKPGAGWVKGTDNFMDSGKTYEDLRNEGKVW